MDNNLEERFVAKQEEDKSDLKRRVWVESKTIWTIAFPSMLSRVTSFGMVVVTQSFLGHIGEVELATYALIQSILVRFVNGILVSFHFLNIRIKNLHKYLYHQLKKIGLFCLLFQLFIDWFHI